MSAVTLQRLLCLIPAAVVLVLLLWEDAVYAIDCARVWARKENNR